MTEVRRRLDRILDPAYGTKLGALDVAELRSRLRECEEVESELSLQRRLLHGRLDILRAEVERRGPEGGAGKGLLDRLSEILTDPTPARRGSRPRLPSEMATEARREVDRLLSQAPLAKLPELTTEEVSALVEELAKEEEAISARRKSLLSVIDGLQAELVARYKDGRASPSDVLR